MNKFMTQLSLTLLLSVTCAFANEKTEETTNYTAIHEPSSASWFSHKRIEPGIWVINDNQQDNIYLVEGEKSALVIDTGLGFHNLKSYIEAITDKPLIVVNTHGHPDHAGGNHVFERVHIHKDELPTLKHYTSEAVMSDVFNRFVNQPMPEHLRDKNKGSASLITIDEGFLFDLGNRTLEVIHVPGHSPGSIALYDKKSGTMFTGDAANPHLWMQIKFATSIEELLRSINKLRNYRAPVHKLLPGHGEALPPNHLEVVKIAAEKLLAGECGVTPYSSPFGEEVSCQHEDIFIVYKK